LSFIFIKKPISRLCQIVPIDAKRQNKSSVFGAFQRVIIGQGIFLIVPCPFAFCLSHECAFPRSEWPCACKWFHEYAAPDGAGVSLGMGFLQIYRADGAGLHLKAPPGKGGFTTQERQGRILRTLPRRMWGFDRMDRMDEVDEE
ncbi:MAG TPA: hypothetical protein VNX46_15590, partial [Candidatus Acidoferrum sp.]|nr:hypothetical protein [Candidatus Acidoferrum sp.]